MCGNVKCHLCATHADNEHLFNFVSFCISLYAEPQWLMRTCYHQITVTLLRDLDKGIVDRG